MKAQPQRTFPVPPAWVQRGARVTVNGSTAVAVVTHVGHECTGQRDRGPVYLRPERGGKEFTAEAPALSRAPGPRFDKRLRPERIRAASRRTP
ncbi:hypothetical protein ABZ502_30165 [Streptomyces abikoensis]|uniref:hypothetical protein n=1 Tax=Streptomyces abikoensis TaxID=97398 RepID=UPI0033EDFC5A